MAEQNQNKSKPENKGGTKIQGRDLCNKSGIIHEFQSIKKAIENVYSHLHIKYKIIKKYINKCLNGNKESYKEIKWQYSTLQVLPGEIWGSIHPKLISGHKYYKISTHGRIQVPNGKITYGNENINGYMNIQIHDIHFFIHRLIAHVFIQNDDKENKTVVNHINEEKNDNRVENLEWCSQSQNINHSKKTMKIQCKYNNKILNFSSANEVINWLKENMQTYASKSPIKKSCKSEFKTAYGIKFWYVKE